MIIVIDNYDSFVHNLARYFRLEGAQTTTLRNDELSSEAILELKPSAIVISPGPKTPREAGVSLALLKKLPASMPMLGVCLGHQCLVEVFGGETGRAQRPLHGQTSNIRHEGSGVFEGLRSPVKVGRYHSLISILQEEGPLRPCAWSEEGEIMAVQHVFNPWFGVQFHPESILTEYGREMIKNFLQYVR